MQKPIVYQLPTPSDNIFAHEEDSKFSRTINYPKFKNGFNHFIYSTKDKMEITKDIKIKKKKFYYVVNPFEHIIDKSDQSLSKITPQYLQLEKKPDILSRAFYKLWELIFMFDLIPADESDFTSVHLAEGPGSFIQAVMYYRDKFAKKSKTNNDKFFGITLHCENDDVPEMEKDFIKYYAKEKPQKFFLHETCDKKTSKKSEQDNGDLTNLKTINNFHEEFKKKSNKLANLVTADGGFVWKHENYQEQEMYGLLLGEIIAGLKVQAVGGNFVIKFFESYTDITIKYMAILQHFYQDVYVVKPLTSRSCNSEKYLVCVKFKKSKSSEIKVLEELLDKIKREERNGNYLVDIFEKYQIPDNLRDTVLKLNMEITNEQMTMINKIVQYINSGNYFGDIYHLYKAKQLESTEYWVNTFYPKSDADFKDNKNKIQKEITKIIINKNKL